MMHNSSNLILARLCMLLLAILISINGALTNWLLDFFPYWEVIFFNASTCMIISTILIFYKGLGCFKVNSLFKHFVRVFSMAIAFIIYVFSIQHFLIIEVMAIYNFAPILSTILAIFFLKEKFNIAKFSAILFGFIGVLFVIQPNNTIFQINSFIPICGSFFVALAYVVTRSIMKLDNIYITVFYYSLGLLTISLFFFPKNFINPNLLFFILLMSTGFLSVSSHYLFALAVKYGEVSSVAPLEYTAFLWTGLLGFFLFNEVPGIMVIFGGIIIIISGVYLIVAEKKFL